MDLRILRGGVCLLSTLFALHGDAVAQESRGRRTKIVRLANAAGEASGKGAKFFFGPAALPFSIASRMSTGASFTGALEETAREDSGYLAGYIVFVYGANKVRKAFFDVDFDTFDSETRGRMNPEPGKVLYVNAYPYNDPLSEIAEYDYSKKYGRHGDATYLKIETYDELITQLKALPQDASFDRIEILTHGKPGSINLGATTGITEVELKRLQEAGLRITAPGADLRLTSCSVGLNTPSNPKGESFLEALGHALLPYGGKVLGATKNILMTRTDQIDLIKNLVGAGVLSQIIDGVPRHLRHDYRQTLRNAAVEVKITPGQAPSRRFRDARSPCSLRNALSTSF